MMGAPGAVSMPVMTSYLTFVILIYLGAVLRVTRLIVADTITEPLRIWFLKHWQFAALWSSCSWCVSMWTAAALAWPLQHLTRLSWWLIAGIGLTASYVTGMVARFDPVEDIEIEVIE